MTKMTVEQNEIEKLKLQIEGQRKEIALIMTLVGMPLPKNGVPQKVNILAAKALVEEEMAKDGLHIIFDEAGNPLLKQRKEGFYLDFYSNNKRVVWDAYVEKVLADKQFIQVKDDDQQNKNNAVPGNNLQHQQNNPISPRNQLAIDELDRYLAELNHTF